MLLRDPFILALSENLVWSTASKNIVIYFLSRILKLNTLFASLDLPVIAEKDTRSTMEGTCNIN